MNMKIFHSRSVRQAGSIALHELDLCDLARAREVSVHLLKNGLWQAKSLRVPAIKCRDRHRDDAIRGCFAKLRLMGL